MNLREAFESIRDIPYRIPLSSSEEDKSCTGKHSLLKKMLEEQGLQVQWRVCSFKWSDIPLPPEVANTPHEDACTHAYLEVLLDGVWQTVDATWDAPLHAILPVSEWGAGMKVAVPVLSTFSIEESARIIANESAQVIDDDLKTNGAFYKAFNSWLESVRAE